MSFLDAICVFMDNLLLEDVCAAHNASHFLDLETYGEIDKQIGPVYWNTIISVAGTGSGAGLYLKLVTSDSATFASGVVVVASIGDAAHMFATADWTLGKCWSIQIPTKGLLKHLGVEFVETTNPTALRVDSWLGMEPLTEQNIQKFPT